MSFEPNIDSKIVILSILIPALLCFLIRWVPRLRYPNAISSDTYFHLDIAARVRANKFRLPDEVDNYVLPHKHLYPHFYHVLLALFPDRWRMTFERMSAAIFETANVALTCFMVAYVANKEFLGHDQWGVMLIGIAVAISPGLLRTYGGPRAYNGSPRILGQLLYLSHVYSFLLTFYEPNYLFYAGAMISGGILLFTAKFGMQVTVLFATGFIILDWLYLVVLAGAMVVAIVLTGGKIFHILRANVVHSYNYFFQQKANLYPRHKTFMHYVKSIRPVLTQLWRFQVKELLKWVFETPFSLHILMVVYPYVYIILYLTLSAETLKGTFLPFALTLFAASLGSFFLTKNKPFLFIGEAERYLEYALPALLGLMGIMAFHNDQQWLVWAYLGYSAVLMLYFSFQVVDFLSEMEADFKEFEELKEVLKKSPEGIRKRVIPSSSFLSKYLVFILDCEVVSYYPATVDRKLLPKKEIEFIYHLGGQTVSKNLESVMDKYRVGYFLTSKAALVPYLNNVFLGGKEVFEANFEHVYETKNYCLYRRTNSTK